MGGTAKRRMRRVTRGSVAVAGGGDVALQVWGGGRVKGKKEKNEER